MDRYQISHVLIMMIYVLDKDLVINKYLHVDHMIEFNLRLKGHQIYM